MKMRTDYQNMTNQELYQEIKDRDEVMTDTLGGYESAFTYTKYRGHFVFQLCLNDSDKSLEVSTSTGMETTFTITKEDKEYRTALTGLLESPYFVDNAGDTTAYTQEEYIETFAGSDSDDK